MTPKLPLLATTALVALAAILTVTTLNAGSPIGPVSIRPDAPRESFLHLISGDDEDADADEDDEDDEDDDDDACEQDDDEGHDNDDEGEGDDEDCLPLMNSAPAGTVAPPDNGLFGNGTPPKVQVN